MIINIEYLNNVTEISIENNSHTDQISNVWDVLREKYLEWLSDVGTAEYAPGKSILSTFKIGGLSTWWMNRLQQKNSFNNTRWLNRIFILFLIKKYPSKIKLITDDKILCRSIDKNNLKLLSLSNKYNKKLQLTNNSLLRLIYSLIKYIVIFVALFRNSDKLKNAKYSKTNLVWFRSLFPVNWIEGNGYDRIYQDLIKSGSTFGYESIYLIIFKSSHIYINFIQLYISIKKITNKLSTNKINYFPLESVLSILDILKIYLIIFFEYLKFKRLCFDNKFRQLFSLDGLNVSDILLEEWLQGYFGQYQSSMIEAIAFKKFLNMLPDGQKIITYGEIFAYNRPSYYFAKISKPKTLFIALQHAMNSKNKMFTYHRAKDFSGDPLKKYNQYSPLPDYFLVKGKQYEVILSYFFNINRIRVIGHQLAVNANKSIDSHTNIISRKDKKIILLSPSIGDDYNGMLNLFSGYIRQNEIQFYLAPHPGSTFWIRIPSSCNNYSVIGIYYTLSI